MSRNCARTIRKVDICEKQKNYDSNEDWITRKEVAKYVNFIYFEKN